jgi:two-component system, cell cycle response regulator DivK
VDPAAGPLILLVDDNEDSREMYAQYLGSTGYRVEFAADGLEAVQKAHDLVPDVVVMDLQMPHLDGWEACRRIRTDPRTKHVPLVALSAHAFAPERDRAEGAGCDVYYTKPMKPDDLDSAIRAMIDKRR